MAWVIDLDGVVWLADVPVPGAAAAVERLRAAGEQVVFVTNNSSVPVSAVEAKLAAAGVEAQGAVVTSATVAAGLVAPGERVLVCGGDGIREALAQRGAAVVEVGAPGDVDVDVVMVGFHRDFAYGGLQAAAAAVGGGARLIATNDDATYPTPSGPIPGGGAILAAVERASRRVGTVAGKPYPPMADHLRAVVGPTGVVIGDRPETDGRMARTLGWRFVLVLSGVTRSSDLPVIPVPDIVAADLSEAVARWARRS